MIVLSMMPLHSCSSSIILEYLIRFLFIVGWRINFACLVVVSNANFFLDLYLYFCFSLHCCVIKVLASDVQRLLSLRLFNFHADYI